MSNNSRYFAYQLRNATLRDLGYKTYQDYLESDLWKSIRSKVLARSKGVCEICREAPSCQAHHLNYSKQVLLGHKRKLRHLVAICIDCHESAEYEDGVKVSLAEANQKMGISGVSKCPSCKTFRVRTDFENFNGTRTHNICKRCRGKNSKRRGNKKNAAKATSGVPVWDKRLGQMVVE